MTTDLTNRQNELKQDIEFLKSTRMSDDTFEYYKSLQSELKNINFLLVHPEYV